ncbi:MAG: hypothetical protein ACI9KN_002029, partial [Gammaproteobacteria bacterium]
PGWNRRVFGTRLTGHHVKIIFRLVQLTSLIAISADD